MPMKKSCKTCQHCGLGEKESKAWCALRRIHLHSDIALFALCHHWTKREPSLPKIESVTSESYPELQLEFNRSLVVNDN